MSAPPASTPPPQKRPRRATFLALGVLYLGAVNLLRAALALDGRSFAQTLPLTMPLLYLAACGAIWGSVFAVTALGIWRWRPWARTWLLAAIVLYQVHQWINHFAFDVSEYARLVWPFHACLSAAWIVAVWGFLFLPGARRVFAKRDA